MAELDLDISNYTIKDIERFFQIKPGKKYSATDIELKEAKIREQLLNSGHISKRFKRDLIDFLGTAKQWLIIAKCNNDKSRIPTTIPANSRLDELNYPYASQEAYSREGDLITKNEPTQYVNTYNSEFFPGNMNPLNTRIITKCLAIDTKYRDNLYSTESSDFIIQLPTKLSKVVSMQLSSIEFPVAFYGISSSYGNNYLYVGTGYIPSDCDCDTVTETYKIITIPDGNYNANDLITTINDLLCPKDENNSPVDTTDPFSYIQLSLDVSETGSGTGKVTIEPSGTLSSMIQAIWLDFTLDSSGNYDNSDITTKLGWNLGFTKRKYLGELSYTAETLIEPATVRYIYMAVDDYNNNVNNHFISAFNSSILSPNILARISIKGTYFSLIMNNDLNILTEPRRYFGPVDIQRLHIKLYDDHGRVLDMNSGNFSFCLNFKMLYDL